MSTADDVAAWGHQWRERAESAESDLLVARQEVERLRELVESLRPSHTYVEDCWYSCPKAPDGCCDDAQGDACNCGADAANARIDAVLAALSGDPR